MIISLFYIVDTLIKDSIKSFENYIYILLGNFEKESNTNSNLDNFINNIYNEREREKEREKDNDNNSSKNDSDEELNISDINDEDKKNKFYDFLIKLKKKFLSIKKNILKRFVLKVID